MFLSQIRAGAGAEDRSPFGDFWFEPIAMRSITGTRVSADTALQLSAVFRAVTLLSGHIAMLPLLLKKIGTNKRIAGHALQKLFKKPNSWQNGFEWRQMIMGHLLLRGNAYNQIVEDRRGNVLQLLPLHPDRVKIEMLTDGDYRYRYRDANGEERILVRGEVWHLRGLSSNGITGLSVIECARESMGLGLAAQAYGARFFANDAKPTSGWIEYPGKFSDKAARSNFREGLQEAQSAANRGKALVLDSGMKYHEIGVTNADAQFLESRKFQISEIARWFGVPPHKLADLERATFSNIEQQSLEYVTDSLLIWAETFEAGIDDVLLFDDEGLESELDFAKLLRGDTASRYDAYGKGINDGWLVRNEARESEGLEPLPGLDKPMRPLNMVEEGEEEEEETETTTPPAKPDPEEEGESARRLQAMIESNAGRMARRLSKSGPPADVGAIAEALAVPIERVERWARKTVWNKETATVENLTTSLIALGSQQ